MAVTPVSEIRRQAVRGVVAGDRFQVSRTFSEEEIERFAALSRDYNPVHLDRRFTDAKGFEGPICHGLLVGALLTEIGGQLGLLASGMEFRFLRPVYPGQRIDCTFEVMSVDERGRLQGEVVMCNPEGEAVIRAQIRGHLPSRDDREVMARMLAEGDPSNGCRRAAE